jgi:hypothetical protein
MLTISQLANCPQHLPQVASWIFGEWGHLVEGVTIEKVAARLQTHLNPGAIPLTLVAGQSQLPVGYSQSDDRGYVQPLRPVSMGWQVYLGCLNIESKGLAQRW